MVYWFGKRLWSKEVGLVAAVFLAGSHFHLQYSRLGVTNIWDPLLVLLVLGFLVLAWQEGSKRLWWLLAGLSIGYSAYFFTSARLLPLMLLPLLAMAFVFDWRKLSANWPHLLATIALAFVVALPQLIYYNGHRDVFMDRANNLGITDNRSGWLSREVGFTGKSRSQIWSEQLRRGLLAFNSGLDNSPSYKPEAPLLSLGPSLLFLLGLAIALWQWRKWPNRMLVVWVLITLIFAAVLLENPPNSHRLIIAAPALSLLAAVALVHFGHLIVGERGQMVTTVMLIVAIALAGLDVAFYYGRYQSQHSFGDRNTEIADEMGSYLSSLDGDWTAYFFGPPSMYVGFPTIPFLATNFKENVNLFDVVEPNATLPLPSTPNQVYIFLPERLGEAQAIQEQFPGGQLQAFAGFHADPLFYAYEVSPIPD
jgi:4-amino-4-deoxy-L-arabinose transferase-like glycosyltransferase